VFENCNSIHIPSRLVEWLGIKDISRYIFTNACQQLIDIQHCKEFEITLKNEALEIMTNFQAGKDDYNSSFERHVKTYKDITHIAIKPNNGKELYIGIPYKPKSRHSYINLLQKNKFEKDSFTISAKEE
jgi:hypothetical protein